MPQRSVVEPGDLFISVFCRGTISLLLQGKRIGVFRSYVNIPTNDQEIVRLFNQAVADLEAGGQLPDSLPLMCTLRLVLCLRELSRLEVVIHVPVVVPTRTRLMLGCCCRQHMHCNRWQIDTPHAQSQPKACCWCWQLSHLQQRQTLPFC